MDALQAAAKKALAGAYGVLLPWQEFWYRKVLSEGLTCAPGTAIQSFYGPQDRKPPNNKPEDDDLFFWSESPYPGAPSQYHTNEFICARDPEAPGGAWGSIIWTESSGLRMCVDTGDGVSAACARGIGGPDCAAWFDYYCAGAFADDCTVTRYAVLRLGYAVAHSPKIVEAPED